MDDNENKNEEIDNLIEDEFVNEEDIDDEDSESEEDYEIDPSKIVDIEDLRRERIKAILVKQQKERENAPPSANDMLNALNVKTYEAFNINNVICGPYMDDKGLHIPCVGLEHDTAGNPIVYYQLIPLDVLVNMTKQVINKMDKDQEDGE